MGTDPEDIERAIGVEPQELLGGQIFLRVRLAGNPTARRNASTAAASSPEKSVPQVQIRTLWIGRSGAGCSKLLTNGQARPGADRQGLERRVDGVRLEDPSRADRGVSQDRRQLVHGEVLGDGLLQLRGMPFSLPRGRLCGAAQRNDRRGLLGLGSCQRCGSPPRSSVAVRRPCPAQLRSPCPRPRTAPRPRGPEQRQARVRSCGSAGTPNQAATKSMAI